MCAAQIERTKTLLKDEQHLCLAEIADDCGFADYNYFITVFARETGDTPEKYRRTLQEKYHPEKV